LKIPRSLVAELPFSSKPKLTNKRSNPTLDTRRAVVMDKGERKVATLIQQINTIKNEKASKAKAKATEKRAEYLKKKGVVEAMDVIKKKERSRDFHKQEGQKRAREAAAASGRRPAKKSKTD
jgi:ribosome biogenesis protein BMS1